MGTNYYLIEAGTRCDVCGRKDAPLHIGKSSAGWCFGLHVGSPSEPDVPRSLDAWRERWSKPGAIIENEYGDAVSAEEMLECIIDRQWFPVCPGLPPRDSIPGPGGLLRHRIGPYCVGHGEGSWDLIPGWFS